jgi:hypothetical protein
VDTSDSERDTEPLGAHIITLLETRRSLEFVVDEDDLGLSDVEFQEIEARIGTRFEVYETSK